MRRALLAMLLIATNLSGRALKDAYVKEVAQHSGALGWQLGNARIQLQITYNAGRLLLTKLRNPQTATDWTPPEGAASLSQLVESRSGDKEYRWEVPDSHSWQLKSRRETSDGRTVGLELVFETTSQNPELEVSLHYRVYPRGFIETWTEIRNLTREWNSRMEALRVGRSRILVGVGASECEIADAQGTRYGEPLQIDWVALGAGDHVVLPLLGSEATSGLQGFVRGFILKRDSRFIGFRPGFG